MPASIIAFTASTCLQKKRALRPSSFNELMSIPALIQSWTFSLVQLQNKLSIVYIVSTRIISELERVHGLTETMGVIGSRRQDKRKPSRNELMMAEQTAAPCPKSQLQTLIDKALIQRPDLLTFVRLLEQEEVT